MPHASPELSRKATLCLPDGSLDPRAIGWSRTPLHTANLSGHWLRKKRWVYWCAASEEALFAITVADVDYLGLAVASLFDVGSGRWVESFLVAPFARGFALPDTVRGEDLILERRGVRIAIEERGDETRLEASFVRRGARVEAALTVDRAPRLESLSVVVPWGLDRYQLTTKACALPVRGRVASGARSFDFESPRAFACLDFGRGVWPYETRWQWAVGAGEIDGRVVEMNLGATWTRGTGATENAVSVEGRLHRIDDELDVVFDDTGTPRRFVTRAGSAASVDVRFEPQRRRALALHAGVLSTRLRWGLGSFRGRIMLADGTEVRADGLRGWAEDHAARW